MNIEDILLSWITSFNPNETQKELSLKRLNICNVCEYKKETIKGKNWSIICNDCGCPIKSKIFSNEFNSCPQKKWLDVDKDYKHLYNDKNGKTLI